MKEVSHSPATPQVSLQAHIDLLNSFLTHRSAIVDRLEGLLNCQKNPALIQQGHAQLSRQFKDCFFALKGISSEQLSLRDQLEHAHWANGFKPRANPGNDLVDPAEMMARAWHFWQQTRWPGYKGRFRYAHTLFNLYLLRCLALLCMRLWDGEPGKVSDALARIQAVLDQLWASSPSDQPVLVKDARWLIPLAMSPTTDKLDGYFTIAEQIADTFSAQDKLETQKAWVQTGAGHLCSQLRHLSVEKDVSLDDLALVLITRMSNALDVTLIVEGLVTLLAAYASACDSGEQEQRRALAASICHGISPDPELFINRLDLLGPYTMIEHLFISSDDDGKPVYSHMGQRHLRLISEYKALISRLSSSLYEDCQQCRPVAGAYSPYGVLYGFSSNLIELMAFKTLQRDTVLDLGLEDIFSAGEVNKLDWVNGWRKLPHIHPEVSKQFEYPQEFADAISARIEAALQRCVADADKPAAASCGRLYILGADSAANESELSGIAAMPLHYILSSDPQIVAAQQAEFKDEQDLLHCRLEGEFLVSYPTAGGWLGISKDALTQVMGAGRDATLSGMPREEAEVLSLMCPELVVLKS